jgi:hypothetical protein
VFQGQRSKNKLNKITKTNTIPISRSLKVTYIVNSLLTYHSFNFFFHSIRCEFHDSFSFPPGLYELHCSLSIGGIPLLMPATQETRCVGMSGGINTIKIYIHIEGVA